MVRIASLALNEVGVDNTSNRQAGSLHAIIIAVLFVALMAALGIVFYQNFIVKKEVVVEKETPVETKLEIARLAFNSDIYRLDYPDGWNSVTTKNAAQTPEGGTITIKNKSGTVQTSFTVSEGGIGGTCDPNDGLKIGYINVANVPVANLATVPVFLVETITDSQGGGYNYAIGLTPDGGATHAVIGDSHCNVGYIGVASSVVIEQDKVVKPTIMANITFPKLQPKGDVAVKDMQQIKNLMKTDDYKTAVKVIESAHKE